MTITVHRVVLARGGEHDQAEPELWHHDFANAEDAETYAARVRAAADLVVAGREHVDVQHLDGDDADPRLMSDADVDHYLGGGA